MPRLRLALRSRLRNLAAAKAARVLLPGTPAAGGGVVAADDAAQHDSERDAVGDVGVTAPVRTGLDLRLSMLDDEEGVVPEGRKTVHVVIPLQLLDDIFAADRPCSNCGEELTFSAKSVGMEPKVTVSCSVCSTVTFSHEPVRKICIGEVSCTYTATSLAAAHFCITTGQGYLGYIRLRRELSMPMVVSRNHFILRCQFLYAAMSVFVSEWKQRIWRAIAKIYDSDAGILDIDVSYDGSWMTRGHSSHIGVGFVIECHTGFVIDMEVLSNDCVKCTQKKNNLTSAEFDAWKAGHTNCKKNFDGKSGAMEGAAAVKLWGRSQELGYRYKVFVGDGDSSAFNSVAEMNDGEGPYSIPVKKEECLNHVGKRLGTRLRKMKASLKHETTTKAGKNVFRSTLAGKKGLTDDVINSLQRHFQQNLLGYPKDGTVEGLRMTLMSNYYHSTSTDKDPRHTSCPKGKDSWCAWNADLAFGRKPKHNPKHQYLAHLNAEQRKHVFGVYMDLTTNDLLSRCFQKRTQNANESLHSKLWLKCLKVKDAKLDRVQFNAQVTAVQHNFGEERGCLLARLGLLTDASVENLRKRDSSRTPSKKPSKRRRKSEPGASSDYAPGDF